MFKLVMSLIFLPDHLETGEVEFQGHPDVFCSLLSAEFIKSLAEIVVKQNEDINELRTDINIQGFYSRQSFNFNVAGQINLPLHASLDVLAQREAERLLEKIGYSEKLDDYQGIEITKRGITSQSIHLNGTSKENKFADSCVVYGHHIASPYGLNGTFASLIIGQMMDEYIHHAENQIKGLRPDGKVHVTIKHNQYGYEVKRVYLSTAHKDEFDRSKMNSLVSDFIIEKRLGNPEVYVNAGGSFAKYFLEADSGVSKAKDDVIITGGSHQLGTDRVWGKCLYKASSTLIPYAFALSKAICDVFETKFASVSAYAEYGQQNASFQLQEIDPKHENQRSQINFALTQVPLDREGIRNILQMPVNIETYRLFNQPRNFHNPEMPWKKYNPELVEKIQANIGSKVFV